jgi:hypothetical protein
MNAFELLVSEFAEKTGLALRTGKDGGVDLVVDGVDVSVQFRPDRGDCILFTLPLYDAEPEPCMQRRALELAANGSGTGGHFLGIKEGMFVLSSVVKPDELSAEDFAKRLIALAAATRRVAGGIAAAVAEDVVGRIGTAAAESTPKSGADGAELPTDAILV